MFELVFRSACICMEHSYDCVKHFSLFITGVQMFSQNVGIKYDTYLCVLLSAVSNCYDHNILFHRLDNSLL